MRLALRYALVYTLVLALGLLSIWWLTVRNIDSDTTTELTEEFAALLQAYEAGGTRELVAAIERNARDELAEARFYLLLSAPGHRLAGNLEGWPPEDPIPLDGQVHGVWVEEEIFPVERFEDDPYCAVIARRLPNGARLLIVQSIAQAEGMQDVTETLGIIAVILGVAVLMALAMSITLGFRMLQRMAGISHTAGEIMAGDLSRRVPLSTRSDEFDALAARLNAMLDRIQQLITGIHEITDNVAHDLRSPIGRLRNRLEVTLLEPRAEAEYRNTIRQSIEDADSLIHTFNALLGIAQTRAGQHRSQWGAVDLSHVAEDIAELYGPVAEDKRQALAFVRADRAVVNGSRHLLAQALGNLLDNAVKYTPEGGDIRLRVTTSTMGVEVVIEDSSPGIPARDRERVLERFVRLDGARQSPGNGLGLSLVQAICALHEARLILSGASPGLRVSIRFRSAVDEVNA